VRAARRTLHPARLIALAGALAIAIPASAFGAAGGGGATPPGGPSYVTSSGSYVSSTGAVAGVEFVPLVNSGETAFGTLFEGIPDGIGAVPGPAPLGYVDLYVAHEQSPVPFQGFADYQNSSVTRVRVDIETKRIIDMDVALSPDLGFIRFCSAFMAGPEQGFPHYTFLLNEESNDPLPVPPGALYGPDPAYGGAAVRQAGFAVYLDTANGKVGVNEGAGRHNHENNVVVPGGWGGVFALSGDDTFTFPSTPERPNLSQVYAFSSKNWKAFQKDQGTLWAFRVTGTQDGPVDPDDPFNGANDYLDIAVGDDFTGEFIAVPDDVARGDTSDLPQDALEDWSNDNNVFQFIRVEDIAYDPDNPRVVYFADTGNSRLAHPDPDTGRLYRAPSGGVTSPGRIFKFVMNADDPTVVDSFSIVVDGADIGMRAPDNLDAGHNSLMVQEDASNAKIWQYNIATDTWTHVATAVQPPAETSGIVDVSKWFGAGWWALDVQSHVNISETPGQVYTGPGPNNGVVHTTRREDGQLLLMYVPGS
jgi:hypothetical protein